MLRGTGILATCSAVRMVVDSTDETSIGFTAPLLAVTTTESRVVASPEKSMLAEVPTLTLTVRGAPPLRLTWYWPEGSCAKR